MVCSQPRLFSWSPVLIHIRRGLTRRATYGARWTCMYRKHRSDVGWAVATASVSISTLVLAL